MASMDTDALMRLILIRNMSDDIVKYATELHARWPEVFLAFGKEESIAHALDASFAFRMRAAQIITEHRNLQALRDSGPFV